MQADILSAEEIKKYLTKERKNNIAVFDTVDSTNTILKNWCAEGKARPGDCVTADCQTKGRGRRGKRFESDKGVGIYLSFLLGTGDATPDEISEITAWGAVAVRRAIEKVCHAGSKIKWVNDIVCGRMKICGILTEMTSAGPVMGIGINVNQSEDGFPPELRNIASSLKIICKREFCRAQIIAAVIEELDLINAGFPEKREEYLKEYRENCAVIGEEISIERGEEIKKGRAVEIAENFGLEVIFEDGESEVIIGGEVSVKGFYPANNTGREKIDGGYKMNKHRKGLYIISGLFYLFFSGALALYPTKMTVGATISMIAGAVLTLAAAVSSFILAAQSGRNPKDSAVRTVVMPICFVGFAVILAADIINTAVHFETAFDAVRIIAELIGAAGHVAAAVIMFKNNMVFIRRNKIAYAVFAAMTGNPASIFVSGAFARERADGECKKLRKAGVIELIVGAVIIVAAYIITNLTLPSDTFRAVTDWLFLCLTLVTDMGLALIAVSTPKDKKKKAKK